MIRGSARIGKGWSKAMLPHQSTHIQSGVLAYRTNKAGKRRILLIGRGKASRWGIPKGKAEPGLSLAENAAKEAFEEAGVIGQVAARTAGKFCAKKRVRDAEITIEVWVYLLKVTQTAHSWPEKDKRRTKWVSCLKAAELLQEPFLKELCARLSETADSPDQQA